MYSDILPTYKDYDAYCADGGYELLKACLSGKRTPEDLIEIMSDSSKTFALYCVKGIKADKKRIKYLLDNSLMLVTALAPEIGYDRAANIAKAAHKNGTTLKEEVIKAGIIKEKEYDKIMNPLKMTKPK